MMTPKTKKSLTRWVIILLILLCAGRGLLEYSRARFAASDSCYRVTTPIPSAATMPYDIVFFEIDCDDTFIHTGDHEVRLRSKVSPYKQKVVFSYGSADDPGAASKIPVGIRWLSPHDLEISPGVVAYISSRYNQVGDLNIHYNIEKNQAPQNEDAGSADWREWFGLGWHVIPDNDNAVYSTRGEKPANRKDSKWTIVR